MHRPNNKDESLLSVNVIWVIEFKFKKSSSKSLVSKVVIVLRVQFQESSSKTLDPRVYFQKSTSTSLLPKVYFQKSTSKSLLPKSNFKVHFQKFNSKKSNSTILLPKLCLQNLCSLNIILFMDMFFNTLQNLKSFGQQNWKFSNQKYISVYTQLQFLSLFLCVWQVQILTVYVY